MRFNYPGSLGRRGSPNPPRRRIDESGALGERALPTEPGLDVHDRL